MEFRKLPSNSRKLLAEIVQAENPTQFLCDCFDKASQKEDDELRGILCELCTLGYVNIMWADDKPYMVTLSNAGRTYEEQLAEYEAQSLASRSVYYAGPVTNNSVHIGNGNRIKNSNIAGSIQDSSNPKRSFFERHSLLTAILGAVAAGVILMFSFWENIITWIEGAF